MFYGVPARNQFRCRTQISSRIVSRAKDSFVGELVTGFGTDLFGDRFTNTVGALWIPGQSAPTPLTSENYAYPKGSAIGQNVGLAYDLLHFDQNDLPLIWGVSAIILN